VEIEKWRKKNEKMLLFSAVERVQDIFADRPSFKGIENRIETPLFPTSSSIVKQYKI
jgi:hypothetical protein